MATRRSRTRRPPASMVIALVALFVALGGPAQAARLIDGADLRRGSVASKQIKDGSIRERDLAPITRRVLTAVPDGAVSPTKLAAGAVTPRALADASVATRALADGAVNNRALAEAAVNTRALAPGSVLSGTVGDNSIGAADLAPNSVGTDEVADNAIGQTEIRNNGVGAAEIADNAIDGGEIIDGGLSVRDIARRAGTLRWPVSDLDLNDCQVATVTVAGLELAGDFVLLSPISAWPSGLVYTANGTSSANEFKLQACNRGATVAAATYLFNYAVLDF